MPRNSLRMSTRAQDFASRKIMVLLSAFLYIGLAPPAFAQYSDDLSDVYSYKYAETLGTIHTPTPIGSLGDIETVVDLRGFVPMSLMHNRLIAPTLHWVKVPTPKALLMLYFGDLHVTEVAMDTTELERQRLGNTQFLEESDVKGETAAWTKFAYSLVSTRAERFFDEVAGGGFQSAQPISIFLTRRSAFIVISFGYSSPLLLGDHGQVLVALEFSRNSRNYKAIYPVYSTTMFSKSTHDMLVATAPYVAKAAVKIALSSLTDDAAN